MGLEMPKAVPVNMLQAPHTVLHLVADNLSNKKKFNKNNE